MATTISRYSFTDDTGDGESGDVLNAALIGASIYDKIDLLFASSLTIGGPTFLIGGSPSSDASAYLQLISSNVAKGWQIGGNAAIAGGFTITPSTTNGGSTFSTPYVQITDAGMILLRHRVATGSGTTQTASEATTGVNFGFDGNAEVGWLQITRNNNTETRTLQVQPLGGNTTFGDGVITVSGSLVMGSASGGSKGAGTINAQAVYDDNVLLTDWVFDLHYDGTTKHLIPEGGRLYRLADVEEATQRDRRLPWMPTRADFEDARSVGGMVTRLWFGQEQQQIFIQDLADRIAALEAA